jgi:hypothetical protein
MIRSESTNTWPTIMDGRTNHKDKSSSDKKGTIKNGIINTTTINQMSAGRWKR